AATGLSRVVVNSSGGVDSAVAAALALQAVGPQNLFLSMMPYGELGASAVENAEILISALQIPQKQTFRIDIKPAVDAIVNHTVTPPDRVRLGNIMARVRMIYVLDLAKHLGALVCGTENRAEHYLGYFTRFGDAASDLEPTRGLYKTQVWELARALNIPEHIIQRAPTAGLWEGQIDEGELGFSYQDADAVLSYSIDEHLTVDEIAAKGIPRDTVLRVLERVASNDFKHHVPYVYPGIVRVEHTDGESGEDDDDHADGSARGAGTGGGDARGGGNRAGG
ncbi:MAG: NAD(+) synthase, partial [Ktedonobacterales bacterium]